MKITVLQTGIPLVFNPGTKLRFKSTNPIFDFTGSFSFPFELNAEKNCVAIGHPERFHRSNVPELVFDVAIESAVLPWERGRLWVNVSNTSYTCSLAVGESEMYSRAKNKTIAEVVDMPVNMGENESEFIAAANAMIGQNFPDVDFQFPLMQCSEPYDNNVMYQFFKFINYYGWHEDTPSYKLNEVKHPGAYYNDNAKHYNITSYVPCPFVFAVLKKIAETCGFRCPNTAPFTDAQINQLIFINTKSIDKKKELEFNDVVKVGRATDYIFGQAYWQSLGDRLLFDDNSTQPYQDVYSRYRLEDYEDGYERGYFFFPTGPRIWQFHYKLIVYNHEEANRTIILHPGLYNTNENFTDGYDEHTIAAGETMTIEGSFVWGEDDGGVGLRATFVPEGDNYALTLKAGSTLDIIPISDNLFVDVDPAFNLSDHLPNILVRDLFDDLKWMFGIVPFTSRDTFNYRFIRDILAQLPNMDLSSYLLKNFAKSDNTKVKSIGFANGFDSADFTYTSPTPNVLDYSTEPKKIIYMRAEGHFYINNHDEYYNFAWARWKSDVNRRQILTESSEGEDVEIHAALPELIMANHDYTEPDHWLPVISLQNKLVSPFNSPDYEISHTNEAAAESNPYILSFWRGMQNDSDADAYPFASPYVYKLGGSVINGINTQLRFNGEYGLYAKYIQQFINMLNSYNNVYTIEMNMPGSVLRLLRFDEIYHIDGINALIKFIDIEVLVDDTIVQPVTLEVVRL